MTFKEVTNFISEEMAQQGVGCKEISESTGITRETITNYKNKKREGGSLVVASTILDYLGYEFYIRRRGK